MYLSDLEALNLFSQIPDSLQSYLIARGGQYGISGTELLRKVPQHLVDNPLDVEEYLRSKDISHIQATSQGGSPNDFNNWIFEDPSINRARGADPMNFHEQISAEIDNNIDAYLIDSSTPDDLISNAVSVDDIESVIAENNFELLNEFLESNLQELVSSGISIGYVVGKSSRQAMLFLRDIDWRRFRYDITYRNIVVNDAFKSFKENGWKELTKSLVIGFLIVGFPPLRFLFIGKCVAGFASFGFRWLASRKFVKGEIGWALTRIANCFDTLNGFFSKLLKFAEDIVGALVEFVIEIAKGIGETISNMAEGIKQIAQNILDWILNFFDVEKVNLVGY